MKRPKEPKPPKGPDELQREIWRYRRTWVSLIALLILGRLLLPHLRMLRGWEQKFSLAAVEIGKSDVPDSATRVTSTDEALDALKSIIHFEPHIIDLEGPILTAAWKCSVLNENGGCLRYIWKGQPLTLAIVSVPDNRQEIHDPFTKSGWNGYLVLHKNLGLVMVSSLDADDIKNVWPYVRNLSASH